MVTTLDAFMCRWKETKEYVVGRRYSSARTDGDSCTHRSVSYTRTHTHTSATPNLVVADCAQQFGNAHISAAVTFAPDVPFILPPVRRSTIRLRKQNMNHVCVVVFDSQIV